MMQVSYCFNCGGENEFHEVALLLELGRDSLGYYARVHDGGIDGSKLVDMYRFDAESYKRCQAIAPQLWAASEADLPIVVAVEGER